MKVPTKSILVSKTAWFGVLVALLPFLESLLGLLGAIGIQWPWVVSVVGGAIVVLRWVTTQPVSVAGDSVVEVP
jgi:hypothetical protein